MFIPYRLEYESTHLFSGYHRGIWYIVRSPQARYDTHSVRARVGENRTQAYVGEGADDDRKASPQTLIIIAALRQGEKWVGLIRTRMRGRPILRARGSGGKTKDKHT